MKNIFLSLIVIASFINEANAQFNEYKYIVVPKTFDAFKQVNQYSTNVLVKHLFTEKGFTTVYKDNLPNDLRENSCLGVTVQLVDESTMFTTKTTLVLKDCSNKEVFATVQGRSRIKEYKPSFDEAIRGAFTSFKNITYTYEPKVEAKEEESKTVSFKNDVKSLDDSTNNSETKKPMIEQKTSTDEQLYIDRSPVKSNFKKAKATEVEKKMEEQTATREDQSFKSHTPASSEYLKAEDNTGNKASSFAIGESETLYAQEVLNGYQLVDSAPTIRMQLFKSSSPNVFIAKANGINGVVFAVGSKWFFEYYNGNELETKELNIKF